MYVLSSTMGRLYRPEWRKYVVRSYVYGSQFDTLKLHTTYMNSLSDNIGVSCKANSHVHGAIRQPKHYAIGEN